MAAVQLADSRGRGSARTESGSATRSNAVKLPGAKGWMVINEKGEDVLKELFVEAPVFYNGHARVKAVGSDTTKVIEDDGGITKSYTRDTREIGSNGLMSGADKNGRTAYLNANGDESIPHSNSPTATPRNSATPSSKDSRRSIIATPSRARRWRVPREAKECTRTEAASQGLSRPCTVAA